MSHHPVAPFINRWKASGAYERANYQLFLSELCELLQVEKPRPASDKVHEADYTFERPVEFNDGEGKITTNFINLYKRHCFVLEAKQGAHKAVITEAELLEADRAKTKTGTATRDTRTWDREMKKAIVNKQDKAKLELGIINQTIIKPYLNRRDLNQISRNVFVIDTYGFTESQLRVEYPQLYQWLYERVKPERDQNKDKTRRENWWLHARSNEKLRNTIRGLERYIVTVQGLIRWLRPEYQNPQGTQQTGMNMITAETAKAATELPEWPKNLAEQAQAVQRALQQFTHPVSPADISRQFTQGKKTANAIREEQIGHLLETICTLGLLRKTEEGGM